MLSTLIDLSKLLKDPSDYFQGTQYPDDYRVDNVLIYHRSTVDELQQRALVNLSHHRFVLFINLKTNGTINIDSQETVIKAGQGMLVMPYQFHSFYDLQDERIDWLFMTFEYPSDSRLSPIKNIRLDYTSEQIELWEQLTQHFPNSKESAYNKLKLLGASTLLIESIHDSFSNQTTDTQSRTGKSSLISQVNKILAEEMEDGIGINDIADFLGKSERLLRLRFKEEYGISLGVYIKRLKLNKAIKLLTQSQLSVAKIASEIGFHSPESFSRFFKSNTNESPKRYRMENP